MERFAPWLRGVMPDVAAQPDTLPAAILGAWPHSMKTFLSRLRADFGSAHRYVRAIGVAATDTDRLRDHLLD